MNLEPITLIWTGIAVVLLVVSARMAYDDWRYFQTVRFAVTIKRAIAWGPRWWLALGFLGANLLFCLAWLLIAAVGGIAISLPPPVSEARQDANENAGYLLVAMEACLASIQFWWQLVRTRTRVFSKADPTRVAVLATERAAREAARIGRPLLHEIGNDLAVAVGNTETLLLTAPVAGADREIMAETLERLNQVAHDLEAVHALVRALGPGAEEALAQAIVTEVRRGEG